MMKRSRYLFAIAALWCWPSSASAINLIYEPFDYTAGADLLGQRNTSVGTTAGTAVQTDTSIGNLWLRGAPAATPADTVDIVNGSLAGPSALKASVGNALTITDTASDSGAADRLAFRADATSAANITSGTVYYSFLLRVDNLNGANDTSGDYFISLNNTANANTTANPTVHPGEMRARIDPTDGTKYNLGMFSQHATITQGNAAWAASTPLSLGETYFVVGAYNVGSTNSSKLWIDPDPLTFGLASAPAPTAQDAVSGTNGATVGSLLLHQRNAVPDLTMDELRVATSWAEVTPLGALTFYWDINGSNTGATDDAGGVASGTWDGATLNFNNAADGTDAAIAWSSGSAIVFSAGANATGASTITVSGTQSAGQITFEEGSVTLNGGTVNLTGALHTISTSTGQTATINSVVGGTVGFVKDGAGTLVLTNTETYSGATTVNGGSLQMGNGGTTGTLPTASAITNNARITFNRSNNVTQGVDFSGAAISGTGGITQAGAGVLTLNAANTFSGSTTASAGTILLANANALQNSLLDMDPLDGGSVSFGSLSAATIGALGGSRNLTLTSTSGNVALTVGNATGAYAGGLSGGSLTMAGSGTQTLTGANTYTGGTTINSGTLQFGQTVAMPISGAVTVNNGGTLGVNAGGAGEWTNSSVVGDPASLAGLIAGTGGQGTANQVTWNSGSTLAVDTTNNGGSSTYDGNIGNFRTAGGGTINNVGFTKRGAGTLELTGTNTFSGQLSIAASSGTLRLSGTSANAGTTMSIPTVAIGSNSSLELNVSDSLPSGSLIQTQGAAAQMFVLPSVTQTVRSLSGNNGVVTVQGGATLTIADQAGDDYVFGNGAGTANLRSEAGAKVYKTGAGSFTLFGDAGDNFKGEFILQDGTLKLSRNQALGSTSSTLTVEGGQLGRSNTPTSNFTYNIGFLNLHVFRFDLSDAPAQTSQFGGGTITTLKENDVEFNITNSGTQTAASGRFNIPGEIRNHDPSPFGGDDPNAIRGISKTGNGVLTLTHLNSYRGSTTVQDGVLLVNATATLGDDTQPTIATLYLKGGILAANATRTTPIKNPLVVDGAAGIGHLSTTNNVSEVVMEFDSDSVVGTSGSLTLNNLNGGTGNTVFKPRFTGKNFNFGLPITLSSPTGSGSNIKSNELQVANATDTQTFSGIISGGGSLRRLTAGGTTVLSGANTYTGGTFVDDGTLAVSGASGRFGGGDVTVSGGNAAISSGVANAIVDTATLTLLGGGVANLADVGFISLASGINEHVTSLVLGSTAQANGTYGATGSGAANINDEYFSGLGVITVGPAGLPGDFNSDGKVDAGDYVTWRKNSGTNNALANDNGLGTPVGPAHYDLWRGNFGNTTSGSGSSLGRAGVPEPSSLLLLIAAVSSALVTCRSRRQ
jgi:autotransporter-associated beta strand protein